MNTAEIIDATIRAYAALGTRHMDNPVARDAWLAGYVDGYLARPAAKPLAPETPKPLPPHASGPARLAAHAAAEALANAGGNPARVHVPFASIREAIKGGCDSLSKMQGAIPADLGNLPASLRAYVEAGKLTRTGHARGSRYALAK